MFLCEICGAVFDQSFIKEWSEPMADCFRERFKQVLCPICGEPYFNEVEAIGDDYKSSNGEYEPQ